MKVGEYKEDEIFKDVIGYEGCYQISNYGTVKSKESKQNNRLYKWRNKWRVTYTIMK